MTQIRRTQHGRKCETKAHVMGEPSFCVAPCRGLFTSNAAIGCLRFGATSAHEVSVTRGRRLPSIRLAVVRVVFVYSGYKQTVTDDLHSDFLRGTQTVRDAFGLIPDVVGPGVYAESRRAVLRTGYCVPGQAFVT